MVQLDNVTKVYQKKHSSITALNAFNLQVKRGEFVVIQGPSGSGKTTLLLTIGGMLKPTSGIVTVKGNDIYALTEKNRTKFRAEKIGFVFQLFHLLPYLSVYENIILPDGVVANRTSRTEVEEILDRLRLTDRAYHKPGELSVGERQRTAIARALLNGPEILLADEPTGNLDSENAARVMDYFAGFHNNGGTVILVTHGNEAEQYADRTIYLKK
ncbi:MAG: ABC transporter ATP-binding protein [Bacteroidales bacterium]|nr:ABC transporter ATP-binding protein [Bacteroidales bacterium]